MADSMEPREKPEEEKKVPKYRGLYEHVHISVRTLNIVILVCIAVIVLVLAVDLTVNKPGFTVSFDSLGGTDVPSQQIMYGQLLDPPEPPTREGYTFRGWYLDRGCDEYWSMEVDTVQKDLTLYAGWEKK